MPHGSEARLDDIRAADVNPVLGWKVVEGEQLGAVFYQALRSFRILCTVAGDELVECDLSAGLRLDHPDFMQRRLGFRLHRAG